MTRLALVLVGATFGALLGGCENEGGTHFPIVPGIGGEGSSMIMADAAVESDAASTELAGRVCLLSDARAPGTCASSGADGLTVTLGSQTVTTGADGSFTMTRPTATNLVWSVSGTGVEPSAMRLSSGAKIPVVSTLLYADMIAGMNATITVDTGAIIARITHAGAPLAGAAVVATPVPDSETYYDGAGVADWNFDATGPFGVVWISSIATGTASLAVTAGAVQDTVGGIPVFAGTITFELAEIP
jgi:hypothetical protein